MLAPYGKTLKALLEANLTPIGYVYLFVGKNSFKAAKDFRTGQALLCLPPDGDVTSYEWPVKDVNILIDVTSYLSQEELTRIKFYLEFCGAKSVVVAPYIPAALENLIL